MDNKTRETILLVEDDPAVALYEADTVETHGFKVKTVCKVQGALTTLESEDHIDLILMDMDLGPGPDGLELAQQILSRQELPIIFLSSYSDRETVERTGRVTNYGYVLKEAGEPILLESIENALKLFKEHRRIETLEICLSLYRFNPIPMLLVDGEGRIHRLNSAAEDLTGTVSPAHTRLGEALNCLNHLDSSRARVLP